MTLNSAMYDDLERSLEDLRNSPGFDLSSDHPFNIQLFKRFSFFGTPREIDAFIQGLLTMLRTCINDHD